MSRSGLGVAAVVVLAGCGGPSVGDRSASVLLISFDGLRWDYPDRVETPALDRLAAVGARVRALAPVFPVETFPNHYTMVTGLYPARHGIVSNTMYDPEFDARFSPGDNPENQRSRWWGGEPVWVTAAKAGLRTSAYYWPGSDVLIDGYRPDPWYRYAAGEDPGERGRRVVEWLSQPATERPHLVAVYFELLDHVGHRSGPESPELSRAMLMADDIVGRLMDGLDDAGVLDDVNIVVVGDHGMAPVWQDGIIFLDDLIDLTRVDVVHWTPVLALNADPAYRAEVLLRLGKVEGMRVFSREETPEEWHYRTHRRITDIVGVAEPGWVIASRAAYAANGSRVLPGAHGYDPALRDMYSTLYAAGPGIRMGARLETLSNRHVYELVCALLEIEPAPNDGDRARIESLLR